MLACPLAYLKNHTYELHQILLMPLAVSRSSSDDHATSNVGYIRVYGRRHACTKVIINGTIFSETAISILVISNNNSFRVLFDKIASVYLI